MNKRLLKPILTSGLLALAFGAIGTGATFALFTSEAETDIVIGAGKVAVSFTPSGLKTYSVEANPSGDRTDERGGKYISKLTTVQGTFTNGGTAAYADGVFTLDKITPGDRITFTATLANQSNVNIKYRLVYAFGGEDTTLARGLVTKTNLSGEVETYAGLKTFRSSWIELDASEAPEQTSYSFDIELPVDKGNEFQQKSARFSMYAEAVQGNADVADEPVVELFEEDFHNLTPVPVVADTATIVEAQNKAGDLKVKTTIPANTTGVDAGKTVDLVVSEMIVGEDPEDKITTLNFDISLYVNNVKTTHFDNSVAVEINVGKYLEITEVKHRNTILVPTTDYTYDPAEGIIHFSTQDFSPFSVTYVHLTDNPAYGFKNSYVENGHWVHVVSTKAHFKNILTNISTRSTQSAEDTFHGVPGSFPLADKTTVYVLANDIPCGGTMWEASEAALFSTRFVGTFDGAGHTISNIHMSAPLSSTIKACLFNDALHATFQNLTLSDMYIDDTSSGAHGLLGVGPAEDGTGARFNDDTYLTFKNITVAQNCFVNGSKNCGGIFAYARSIKTLTLENCVNYADISVSGSGAGYVAGGFIASATSHMWPTSQTKTRTFIIKNCENHGNISGTDALGGVAGAIGAVNSNDLHDFTINGFLNTGNISDESSDHVSPVIAGQNGSINRGATIDKYTLSGIIDNTGTITMKDGYANDYAFGLFTKNGATCPVLSNGNQVTDVEFFMNHVIASGVVAFSTTAAQLNTACDANNKLSLNLSGLSASVWAQAAKIKVSTKLTWTAPVSYTTDLGYGAGAGQYPVHDEIINISDHAVTTYDVTRLCYVGHTYPAGKNPADVHIYYDGDEPQGPDPFQYNHEYYKLEGTDSRRGWGTTAGNAAYYVLDNDAIVGGTYRLLAENYTESAYVIEIFDANNVKLAYSTITDFNRQLQSTYKLGKMSQIA